MGSKALIKKLENWNTMIHTGKKEYYLKDIKPGKKFICPSIQLIGEVINHGIGSSIIRVLSSKVQSSFTKGKSITIALNTTVYKYYENSHNN